MKITRRSLLTGVIRTKEISVTEEQIKAWEAGGLIQEVMPGLTPDEREFLMTGIDPSEWEDEFSERGDEE